jgi:putative flippase GtrA
MPLREQAEVERVNAPAATRERLRSDAAQFVKFGLVGLSGVVVNVAVFSATLLLWLGLTGHIGSAAELTHSLRGLVTKSALDVPRVAYYVANALGFAVSVMTNYYLNRRWTFRSTGRVASELPKFVAVSIVAYAGNLAVFTLAHTQLQLGPLVSQLIAIVVVMPINYVANRLWSFRQAPGQERA